MGGYKAHETDRKKREAKIGKKFNKLTIISIGNIRHGIYTFNCLCDCGNKVLDVIYGELVNKKHPKKSCGCINLDVICHSSGEVKKRIEKNIIISENGCWEWQRRLNFLGYGQIKFRRKMCSAHRVSYEIYKGEFDQQQCVLHQCDNRRCVNPDHLFLGDDKINAQDRAKKGRNNHYKSKLDVDSVLEIRSLYPKYSLSELSRRYGRNLNTIWCIVNRKTWKNI